MKYEEEIKIINDASWGWEKSENEDKKLFNKAYKIACDVHKNQVRDEGTPYITHIDAILKIFKDELFDSNYIIWVVIALHDVLEDSNEYTYDDIEKLFNENIAKEVQLLTKEKGQNIESYIIKMKEYEYSYSLIKIKLADRLHNVRSLNYIINKNREKVIKYIEETEKYYLPLADEYNKMLYQKLKEEIEIVKGKLK